MKTTKKLFFQTDVTHIFLQKIAPMQSYVTDKTHFKNYRLISKGMRSWMTKSFRAMIKIRIIDRKRDESCWLMTTQNYIIWKLWSMIQNFSDFFAKKQMVAVNWRLNFNFEWRKHAWKLAPKMLQIQWNQLDCLWNVSFKNTGHNVEELNQISGQKMGKSELSKILVCERG